MGEEGSMKKRMYLVPVIAFIISFAGVRGWSNSHQALIAEAINTAGRNGYPVFVTHHSDADWFNLRLNTIDYPSIGLGPRSQDVLWSSVFFTEDGAIATSRQSFEVTSPGSMIIRLPDFNERRLVIPERTAGLHLPGEVWIGIHIRKGRWDLGLGTEALELTDFYTGERINSFYRTPPIQPSGYPPIGLFDVAPDVSAIALIDGRNYLSGNSTDLWMYNLSEGEWTLITDQFAVYSIAVGVNGSVVGIEYFTRDIYPKVTFFESTSLDPIVTVERCRKPWIGHRWAACTQDYSSSNATIFLFDMQDNWKEYSINLPIDQNYGIARGIAFYEPPPNGLDGMYENYRGIEEE